MDVELVKDQHLNTVQQRVHGLLDCCSIASFQAMCSAVDLAEEVVEVDTPLPRLKPSVEAVHQPGFPAAHRAVQVEASWRLSGKRPTAACHLGAKGRQPLSCLPLAGFKGKTGLPGVVCHALE